MKHPIRRGLAALLACVALPGAALAAYTPGAKDTVVIQDQAFQSHRVNAQNYINAQRGNGAYCSAAPTIGTTFGTADSVVAYTPGCAMSINIGTSNTGTGVITLPAAAHGWICTAVDITTTATTQAQIKQIATGSTTTACALQNYTDIAGTHAMTDSDILYVTATPF